MRAATLALLRDRLRSRPEALEFARSVALHLSHPPGGQGTAEEEARAVERVVRLLDAAGDPDGAARLATDPALLASVFQNIDLLFDQAYAGADAVALLVMDAVQIADRSP